MIALLWVLAMSEPPERVRLGVGVERPLGLAPRIEVQDREVAIPGLGLTVDIRGQGGVQALLGAGGSRVDTSDPTTARRSVAQLVVAIRGLYWPVRTPRFRLGLVIGASTRIDFEHGRAVTRTNDRRTFDVAAEVGLRPELFLVPRLSLHTQFGASYVFETTNDGDRGHTAAIAGDLLGQAGFTAWF